MARKSKRNKPGREINSAAEPIAAADNSAVKIKNDFRKGWWFGLSRQGKLLTIGIIAFLTLGAFGATMKYLEDSVRQNSANGNNPNGTNEQSLLAKINPFAPAAMTSPTPTPLPLSKEYIYAGSRLLAVEDANATAAPPADLAVWRPSSGVWWVMGGTGSQQVSQQWGQQNDKPVPGDYDGDGKTDFAIFRPDNTPNLGYWYILYSSTSSWTQIQWGQASDIDYLAPADYDGDGRTDVALWRPSNGGWYILKTSDNAALTFTYGSSGDKPAPADYDGDGKADVALWRNSNSTFYSKNSSDSAYQTVAMSQASTEPVPADYDGDGKADYAIRSGANWIIRNSSTGAIQPAVTWQSSGDKAVHNDYDGDGKCDIAVWKDATGYWYILKSSNGQTRTEQWGMSGDTPVPAFYRR